MGLIKLAAVVFGAYVIGGRAGEIVVAHTTSTISADALSGARWAGRAVAFVGFSYLATKL